MVLVSAQPESGPTLTVGVPRETIPGERRVALTPDVVKRLSGRGFRILVEREAGVAASYPDGLYTEAGATIVPDVAQLYREADVILKVQRPTDDEVPLLREGQVIIAFLSPLTRPELVVQLAERKVTALSMDAIPRITRAQPMDALSSMSTIAGYKAVLLAANALSKFFPLLMTAAGTIPPARVLVLGAGVAGLQAIATARRLGAVVEAFDTRPVVKEQVESLGATFLELDVQSSQDASGYATELEEEHIKREIALIKEHAARSDVIITTALIPGRPAPLLLPEDTVANMRPGSVIVDLAAEMGGNCELTKPGETIVRHNVTIMGPLNLPSEMAYHASQMYAKNIGALLEHLAPNANLTFDMEDSITAGVVLTRDGEVLHGPTREWMKERVA
ncbi:Re/Si-specific NAD(P)(+) transhydrogenase subunit alpha [Sphaerobacter sp.]|uniref:Re/Si-specific NAD(P)(+) transhydrogenase subunit alpha n=1 Tax=Sphaerobacter sp. TaxID=2099654 RepID=UPI001D8414C2|nr:Re/Si-specific NAD(P)(+) transhydrogenase subunit alpha [Sphaerobacter sp.]MBX5446505.1 Re/Si-specific NAD(P)(+) transhydrogenase subunit alpha [Sphaerobacter sp.]